MKIGCGAQISEVLLVKRLGFDYIELRGRAIAALSNREFEQTVQVLVDEDLPCLGINGYCPPEVVIAGTGYDRAYAKRYAATLAARAAVLGVKKVGVGSPLSRNLPEGFSRRLAYEQTVEFMADAAESFGRYGIRVGLEPLGYCFCNFLNRIDEVLPILEKLKAYEVGLILDFYNMDHSQEGDMELTAIAPWILHAHTSDDAGLCSQRADIHAENHPRHREQISRLLSVGYDDTLSLEVDVPLSEESAESLRFLRSACDQT